MYWSFWWFRGRFREISDEARGQRSDGSQGKFWWPELLFIQTSRVVFCYMISFILLLVTLLYRKAWYTQWCQPLDISNLEIFFSDQNPRDRICQWDSALENLFFIWTPYPPLLSNFARKTWIYLLNTHPIRLSLISDWQRKDSLLFVCNEQHVSCKKMKPETVIQA